MPWPGGKSGAGVYHRLCAEVPPHDVRISPFLGHCAVMRHLRPAPLNIGIDLDPAALELWRGFRWEDAPQQRVQLIHGDALTWLRQGFGLDEWPQPVTPLLSPEEVFRRLYRSHRGSALASAVVGSGARAPLSAAAEAPSIPFLFVDPPYPRGTLSDRHRYVSDLTDEQHLELLTVLRSLPALVMVVSYPNPLYAEQLQGWRTFTYRARTRQGTRTEQAWCNYPQPVVLHDWRFIGRDRRQREVLARRVRSWRRMFAQEPPPVRAALLDGLLHEAEHLGQSQSIYRGLCDRCGTLRADDQRQCPVCTSGAERGVVPLSTAAVENAAVASGGDHAAAGSGSGRAESPRPRRSRPKQMARRAK